MYDTLQPELITASRKQRKAMTRDPTEVICYHLFQENQFPYLEVSLLLSCPPASLFHHYASRTPCAIKDV